jgi:hypothetical protein
MIITDLKDGDIPLYVFSRSIGVDIYYIGGSHHLNRVRNPMHVLSPLFNETGKDITDLRKKIETKAESLVLAAKYYGYVSVFLHTKYSVESHTMRLGMIYIPGDVLENATTNIPGIVIGGPSERTKKYGVYGLPDDITVDYDEGTLRKNLLVAEIMNS